MKKIWNTYRQSIILIGSVIIGGLAGIIFKDKVSIVAPLGDLFLNLLLVIIVPLVFLTISTSIGRIKDTKKIGKILVNILVVFLGMSLISLFIGFGVSKTVNLVNKKDSEKITQLFDTSSEEVSDMNLLERTVTAISVSDFSLLLTRDNLLGLMVFSIIIGIALSKCGKEGNKALELLESLNAVVMKYIDLIMYYAPIGLACYFANLVGTLGSSITIGFLKTFIMNIVACAIVFLGVYPLLVLATRGKKGLKEYWKHILPPTFTALGTCSSAACIPVNNKACKNMGLDDVVVDTTIPLGSSFHKDGSIIGSVFKIMFLVSLFNSNASVFTILLVALVATLLISAVPIGGGTISETFIISMLGFPIAALPILTIIATIIDAPATLLNAVGDIPATNIVQKLLNKKPKK